MAAGTKVVTGVKVPVRIGYPVGVVACLRGDTVGVNGSAGTGDPAGVVINLVNIVGVDD